VSTSLPVTARLAWWGTSWLRGHVGPDDLLDAVLGDDVTHTVLGRPTGLVGVLGELRAAGATAFAASFPVEGDPVGLGGPPAFTTAAVDLGEAVVVEGAGTGLLPHRVGPTLEWEVTPARRAAVPDVGEADRGLRATLLRSAESLAELDVARWRPEVADRLMDLRRGEPVEAPPGVPPRCVALATRGLAATGIADLALEDDGGALSAAEMQLRRDALLPLHRAGRHALTAACSPAGWPPD